MLKLSAQAVTVKPDGRGAPEVSLGGQRWWYRTGTSSNRGRLRQKTGLSVLFGIGRQSYYTYQTREDGLPIWGMSFRTRRRRSSRPRTAFRTDHNPRSADDPEQARVGACPSHPATEDAAFEHLVLGTSRRSSPDRRGQTSDMARGIGGAVATSGSQIAARCVHHIQPGFPRWVGFWLTFWRCLSKGFRGLRSRKRVQFAFTRCIHHDRALSDGVTCWCGYQIWRAEQGAHQSIWGIRDHTCSGARARRAQSACRA
jgi:hypothetical protein